MTYKLMKRIITKGGYDREKTLLKLDVFKDVQKSQARAIPDAVYKQTGKADLVILDVLKGIYVIGKQPLLGQADQVLGKLAGCL